MAYYLGVELSSSYFKLVEVKKRRRKFSLEQIVVHPLPSIWSKQSTLLEREELVQTIQEALLGRRLHTEQVHVGIDCREVVFKRVTVPEMRKGKYRHWIEENVLPILDLPFPDPAFDFQLVDHVWADGDEQEILLALVPNAYLQMLTRVFRYCGLDPVRVDLAPFSLYRWVDAVYGMGNAHTVLIRLSKTDAEVSFFLDGRLQDVQLFSLPMTFFLQGNDRPHPDPLRPILTTEEEVARYGKVLLSRMVDMADEKRKKAFFCPNAEWYLAGEGMDLYLLEQWLIKQKVGTIKLAPPAEIVMTEYLKDRSSCWVRNSLSVPLGLILKEKEGIRR